MIAKQAGSENSAHVVDHEQIQKDLIIHQDTCLQCLLTDDPCDDAKEILSKGLYGPEFDMAQVPRIIATGNNCHIHLFKFENADHLEIHHKNGGFSVFRVLEEEEGRRVSDTVKKWSEEQALVGIHALKDLANKEEENDAKKRAAATN